MKYIVYERSESGTLTRTHAGASLCSEVRRDSYPWREKLTGWPERSVFWARPFGPSVGVAPALRPAAPASMGQRR